MATGGKVSDSTRLSKLKKIAAWKSHVTLYVTSSPVAIYCLRYIGHILRKTESRLVRRALVVHAKGGTVYPKGSLFMDCQGNGYEPASGISKAAPCVECTGQTITLRRTAIVSLDPLGLRWNSYIFGKCVSPSRLGSCTLARVDSFHHI